MAAEDFFRRWSRPRQRGQAQEIEAPVAVELPPPGMEDVQQLGIDSDYARFIAAGVDEEVKRAALKKLFADPHFNVMDGLDVYVGDYSVSESIPPAMLSQLHHAKALLDPLAQFEKPLMKLREQVESVLALADAEPAPPASDDSAPAIIENSAEPAVDHSAQAEK